MAAPSRTAIHEAGHAVIGRLLGFELGPITIAGDRGRIRAIDPTPTPDDMAVAKVVALAITYLGGAAAESAVLGSAGGPYRDEAHARRLAAHLAPVLGLTPADVIRKCGEAARDLCARHVAEITSLAEGV